MTAINTNSSDQEEQITKIINSIIKGTESDYLIIENRKRCKAILSKPEIGKEDLIDAFIYLHIVMEAGLNGFFRNISLSGIKKGISELEITKNLDDISFIHKVILFIYNSSFDFGAQLADAERYHSIIGKLKNFTYIRNMLVHGHAIKMVNENGTKKYSQLSQQLTKDTLNKQINDFKFILEGMQFYINHLNIDISDYQRSMLIDQFLDYNWTIIN